MRTMKIKGLQMRDTEQMVAEVKNFGNHLFQN